MGNSVGRCLPPTTKQHKTLNMNDNVKQKLATKLHDLIQLEEVRTVYSEDCIILNTYWWKCENKYCQNGQVPDESNGQGWDDCACCEGGKQVTEYEWEWVVNKIVLNLSEDNSLKGRVAYRNVLLKICGSFHAMLFATTEQKAKALMEIGAI